MLPAGHLRALADGGLFGLMAPGADLSAVPAVFEALAGACGVTFFVWAQHHAPVRLLGSSANSSLRQRWLGPLVSGDVLGGVAFAHLRRPGPPAVAAERVDGGFLFTGEAPWVTSWGVAGVLAVGAKTPDGERVVWAAVPGRPARSVRASERVKLVVMNASATVRLAFDRHVVGDADVIAEVPFPEWQAGDRAFTAMPNPAVFGVASTALRWLAELQPEAAARLAEELADCRERSYGADPEDLEKRFELRAWSLELAQRAAYALVAATGGRAMERSNPAQRLLREAAFYAVQAQTPERRQAMLGLLTR